MAFSNGNIGKVKMRQYRLISIISTLSFCAALFLSQSLLAQDDVSWSTDRKHVEGILKSGNVDENLCQDAWGTLWSWAKRGNLDARAMLSFYLLPPPYMSIILMPGRSSDYISRTRDALVVSTHSVGGHLDEQQEDDFYYSLLTSLYSELPFRNIGGAKVLMCLQEKRSSTCADVAVKAKLVPSFDVYAAEVDALVAQGLKAKCL